MFRIRVEKSKNSGDFINYFVDERVCEIINDILLTQGFIEASTESWHDIQKYHGHRVRVSVGTKTESTDSGIEQSLEALPLSPNKPVPVPVNDRITKLESEINIALKELSSLKKEVKPKDVKSSESFDFKSFQGLWENSPVSDTDPKEKPSVSLPSTPNLGTVWAPDWEEKKHLKVKNPGTFLKGSSVAASSPEQSNERTELRSSKLTVTGGKPLQRIQRDEHRTSRYAGGGTADVTPIGYLCCFKFLTNENFNFIVGYLSHIGKRWAC